MNKLAKAIRKSTNIARTENGALSLKSTGNALLDAFQSVPVSRSNLDLGLKKWVDAYREDWVMAVMLAFYVRDIRGGQGEKAVFSQILKWLRENDTSIFNKIVSLVPEYGYWKDLIEFVDEDSVRALIHNQLKKDMRSDKPSLLGKWMPSANASSKKTRELGRMWASSLGLTEKKYREVLTALRSKIGVVESLVSENKWSDVKYESVPSVANKNLSKAFLKHDEKRRKEFLSRVMRGETAVKSAVLQPHELVSALRRGVMDNLSAEAAWKSLPDYTNGENALCMADVSGSMEREIGKNVRAIDASVALAVYFAQRNTGAFHNLILTFTDKPHFINVGDSLKDAIGVINGDVGYDTNLQAAFDILLSTAIKNKVPQKDMPTKLYIVSDMEFNPVDPLIKSVLSRANGSKEKTNFEAIKAKYKAAGYKLPVIVFWTVNSKTQQYPASASDENVVLIGGLSSSTFETVAKAIVKEPVVPPTPEQVMKRILTSERYAPVFDSLM